MRIVVYSFVVAMHSVGIFRQLLRDLGQNNKILSSGLDKRGDTSG